MIRELNDKHSYPRVMTFISILTFVFGVAVCFMGTIFVPFASSFLAALFLFENPQKRILSYVCPIASILLPSIAIGISAVIGVEYVLIALLLVCCYKKSLSKAETAIYLTFTIVVFILASLYLEGAVTIGDFSLSAVKDYYVKIYLDFNKEFVKLLSEFTVTAKDGTVENLMSVEDAKAYFKILSNSVISVVTIFAFILAGITEKIYAKLVLGYSKHGILKTFAHFIPSNLCCFAYIAAIVLSIFTSDSTVFGISVSNISNILMAVFLYMGLKYLSMVAKMSTRRILIYGIIIAGFISFPSVAPNVISYLGVWVVIGTNSQNKISSD